MPQIPGMSGTRSRASAIAMSQVEVPMILTKVPTRTPAPTAP